MAVPAETARLHDEIIVSSNGVDHEIKYEPHEAASALLEAALNAFHIHDARHTYALWTESGVELPITGSAQEAGVRPGDVLFLRPSVVRGG